MNTLYDELHAALTRRDISPLVDLLNIYDGEKELAKCYSTFAYLSCSGAGGTRELAESMRELIESFYLSTSIHDDVLDSQDENVSRYKSRFSPNTYMVLGDCFFVRMGIALARATPHIPVPRREVVLRRYEQYVLDVAESQIVDEQTHGKILSRAAAVRQMKLRGGTWGRICVEIPALAGGLDEEDAARLGAAGESLFMSLTVRDDLMDLRDDILNGVLTLAPALYLENSSSQFHPSLEQGQTDALIDLLYSDGAVSSALDCGREYATTALKRINDFLGDKHGTDWYLLLMLFRIMEKRFTDFTPDHVRDGKLGSGLAGISSIDSSDIRSVH